MTASLQDEPDRNRNSQLLGGAPVHVAHLVPSTRMCTSYVWSRYIDGAVVLHTSWFGVLCSWMSSHCESPIQT